MPTTCVSTRLRGQWAIGAAAACLLAAMTAAAAQPAPGPRLEVLPQQWLDDAGRPTALTALLGHRVVLTMAYARCRKVCPATMARLERMQRDVAARGEPTDFVVVGYDPARDRPDDWRRFREQHGLQRQANWHFLTGSRRDTERLAHQLGFGFWNYDDHVIHDARIVVFDAAGNVESALGPDADRLASLE